MTRAHRDSPQHVPVQNAPVQLAAVILAAGGSRRFGAANKLLARVEGEPLWWRALDAAAAAPAAGIVVVVGHQQRRLRLSLRQWRQIRRPTSPLRIVRNLAWRSGMASSLQAGLRALPAPVDGALIVLADMPAVPPAALRRLCSAYRRGDEAVLPVARGQHGNPALLGRPLFAAVLRELRGDQGARKLIAGAARVREVPAGAGCLQDIDTRRQCARLRGRSMRERR